MIFNYDYFGNIDPPQYVLCKASGDRIGVLNCTKKNSAFKFNAYDEVSFVTYMYIDGIKNPYYDLVKEGQFIELPLIGRYVISNVDVQSEGTDFEYKECTGLSAEVLIAQKYIENFTINMGTVESVDNVRFYHQSDPSKSLLHLLLAKCPDWEIGHVDVALMDMERCFEIDRDDIYNVLINEVSQAFQCVFVFDSLHHRINAYEEKNVGKDTNIFISYENLLKDSNISSSIEDIKTCLTVTGASELNLREVNMGYDRIYNLEYFNSLEFMSEQLFEEYNAWKTLWNQYVEEYGELSLEYQNYCDQIYELKSKKMPEVTGSTDWTEYGLVPLQEQLAAYEQQQAVMIKQGQGEPGTPEKPNPDYEKFYVPCYNAIQAIKNQLVVVEQDLNNLENKKTAVGEEMASIAELTAMENNFSSTSLKELAKFIREDELSSDNFIVTDTMTDSERMDMLKEMLEYGQKELEKVSQPVLEFDSTVLNLYNMPEFKEYAGDFEPGNYIHINLRDDYAIKARMLTMDIDWLSPENFSVTFGNVMKLKGNKFLCNVTEALELATSAATSVSMNASYWNKANKETSDIMNMLADGLAAAGQAIHTSQSDVVIDDRGIIISNIPESAYPKDRIFIGGSQILFSDDDFQTISTALGRLTYEKLGTKYDEFGLMANFVISGYVASSIIEGNEIYGGKIVGTEFNNGNGTFKVDKDGNLTANSATVTGTINANEGKIGGTNGFTIQSGKIYSGSKSTLSSTADGVYIGTDGISLGSKFSVTNKGELKASSGTFSGTISGGSININDNFVVTSDGTLTAKKGTFSGAISGGSININNNFVVTSQGVMTAKDGIFTGTIDGSDITGGTIEVGALSADNKGVSLGDFTVSADESYMFKATNNSVVIKTTTDPGGSDFPIITLKQDGGGETKVSSYSINTTGNVYGYAFMGDENQTDTYSRFYDIKLAANWWLGVSITKRIKLLSDCMWELARIIDDQWNHHTGVYGDLEDFYNDEISDW